VSESEQQPESAIEPDRDTWTTMQKWADAVGDVELDPASNERSLIHARRTFDLSRGQDGLTLARFVSRSTRVFCNCPYSRGQVIRWVTAYRHTRFTFLLRFDVSTDWWEELWPYVSALCLPKERMEFDPPPGVDRVPGSPFPHAFLYANADDITAAMRAACYVVTKERTVR
jgi:hypothetical protein